MKKDEKEQQELQSVKQRYDICVHATHSSESCNLPVMTFLSWHDMQLKLQDRQADASSTC